MANFSGSLRTNEIFGALFNMIISQTMLSPDLDVDDFVGQFRVDGTLYGDTKLYYSADVLGSKAWGNDSEAANLLALHRPDAPECQAVTISNFRQISLTLDDYLSKRAWADEGAFSQFQAVMLGMIGETKKVIDYTMLATFIGTETATTGSQLQYAGANPTAQKIAETIANILVDMKRPSREYNNYEHMRAYAPAKLKMIWNAKYINQIKKLDLPTIFNAEMVDVVNGDVLPPEYFGEVKTGAVTVTAADVTAKKYRFLIEIDKGGKHYFPGDVAPAGSYTPSTDNDGDPMLYEVKSDIICKIIGVGAVPFMSAFEVGTSFFNAKSLTTNHYLTWGYSDLTHLDDKPFVTVYAKAKPTT